MAILYRDKRIVCDDDAITISMYHFPAGSKRIPYNEIRGIQEHKMGPLTGRYRLWGASDPRYWFHLDADRPHKTKAIILDKGGWIRAVITPDDPDAVLRILEERTGLSASESSSPVIAT